MRQSKQFWWTLGVLVPLLALAQISGPQNYASVINLFLRSTTAAAARSAIGAANSGSGGTMTNAVLYGSTSGSLAVSSTGDLTGTSSTPSTTTTTGAIVTAGGLGVAGAVNQGGKTTTYNGISTAANGFPVFVASGRSTAQTGQAASVCAYTVGGADGSFMVGGNVNVTTATSHSFNLRVNYTDETNTGRTQLFLMELVTGSATSTIQNSNGAVTYVGVPVFIRAKSGTAITVSTGGTFTTVVYNVEGFIAQIN